MPAIFFGHGSPMNAIEENLYSESWVEMVKKISADENSAEKPRAILVISAHYETNGTKVTSNQQQKTIHDFYGFPPKLFAVKYEPPGDLKLAKRLQEILPEVELDDSWGVDHGAWSVLVHTHPAAEIPVIQLSIDHNKTTQQHYELAKKLRVLREEKILIIGSGNIVHNLRMIDWHSKQAYPWAVEFNNSIVEAIEKNDHETILNFVKISGAKNSVPTSEHFIPLLYVLALQEKGEKVELFCNRMELGSISMASVAVGV